jgi:hypothetical protein
MARLQIKFAHGQDTVVVKEKFGEVEKMLNENQFIKVSVGPETRLYNRNDVTAVYWDKKEDEQNYEDTLRQ